VKLWALRPPVVRWWWLVFVVWALQIVGAVLRWLAVRWQTWVVLAAAAVVAGGWWLVASGWWPIPTLAAGIGVLTVGGVMELQPAWWRHLMAELASWRRRREYEAGWEDAMDGAGLVRAGIVPTLLSHRFGGAERERDLDVLTVRMAPGQLVSDWRAVQLRLASAFGLQRLRCHHVPGCPQDVQLYGRRSGLSAVARQHWAERTSQLDVRMMAGAEPSTAVEEPVDDDAGRESEPRGAFPRHPGSAR
jgi:hypothetical protein